jgi:hypothetical protein
MFDQTKDNKVFPPYKTAFLELATPFLLNITKTPEQSCSTIEFWSRAAPEWSNRPHSLQTPGASASALIILQLPMHCRPQKEAQQFVELIGLGFPRPSEAFARYRSRIRYKALHGSRGGGSKMTKFTTRITKATQTADA